MTVQLPLGLAGDAFDGPDVDELVETAIAMLAEVLRTEVLALAWSSGKDSTVCVILALMAWLRAQALGYSPAPLILLHGDTLVESPPVRALADDMLAALTAWCEVNFIPLIAIVYRPPLNQSFAVKVLSGTVLPTFPEARRRICSASWKVEPSGKALAVTALQALVAYAGEGHAGGQAQIAAAVRIGKGGKPAWAREPVIVLGSRLDESQRRALSMKKHAQAADRITTEEDGRRTLSPIAAWSELDVWEVIGLAGHHHGVYPVWQRDFSDLVALYRGAAGGCVIIPGKSASPKGCGARFGCYTCLAVQQDESAKALTEEPRWAYAAPLLRIRDYIANIRHDLSRRCWLDSNEDPSGYTKVFPGPLSGATTREIIRFYMTADRDERDRADRFRAAIEAGQVPDDPYVRACHAEGREPEPRYMERMRWPQFRMFDARNAIACDIYASLRGHQAEPFGVLQAWHEVWHLGLSFYPPDIEPSKAQRLPEPRWIPTALPERTWGQDTLAAAITELCPWENDIDPDGWPLMPQDEGAEFEVNEEAAWFIVDYEYPDHLHESKEPIYKGPFSNVYYYMNIGCLLFTKQGKASLVRRLRRLERWDALDLIEKSPEDLLARSISSTEFHERGGAATPTRQLSLL